MRKLYLTSFLVFGLLFIQTGLCFSQGSGLYFKKIDANPKIEILDSLNFSTQTLEMYIRYSDLTDSTQLISDDFQYDLKLKKVQDTAYLFYSVMINGQWLTQRSSTSLLPNKWYYVVAFFDGKNLNIKLNGHLSNQENVAFNQTGKLTKSGNNTIRFDGDIDEVRIWNTTLTESKFHFWRFIPLCFRHEFWENLLLYLRCNDNIKQDANNQVINQKILDLRTFSKERALISNYESSKYLTRSSIYTKSNYQTSKYVGDFNFGLNKSVAIQFNNNLMQIYNPKNQMNGCTIKYGNINDKDKFIYSGSDENNGIGNMEVPSALILYKDSLVYLTYSYNNSIHYYVADYDNLNNNPFRNKREKDIKTKISPTMAIYKDTLYLFYLTGGVIWAEKTTDLKNWTKVAVIASGLDSDKGGFSTYKYRDTAGLETIYVAYADDSQTNIVLKRFYGTYTVDEAVIPVDNLRNVSIVPGTIKGGFSNGYTLQIFYSSNKPNGYGCDETIGRIEYSIENQFAYDPEVLDICSKDGAISSQTPYQFQPYAFEYFKTIGDNQKSLGKKIVMSLFTMTNMSSDAIINIDYLVWDSDKMIYIPEADTTDTNPDKRLSELIGVIEGPPPYVLNEDNLDSLVSIEIYPSMLEFGSSTSSDNELSVAVDKKWTKELMIDGYAGDYEKHIGSVTDTSVSKKVFENSLIFPTAGRPVGYMLFQRPIFTRKKFELTDGNGNFLDYVYSISISDKFLDWVPYYLDTVASAPNPANMPSYINRNIDFEKYDKYFSKNYIWARGIESSVGLETDSMISNSSSLDIGYAWGRDVSISLGVGEGVEVDMEIFRFESRIGTSNTTESTTSISNSKSIVLTTKCPFHGREHDTSHIEGVVYWLKPTKGLNNWWIPKGWESSKPWCITYKLNAFNLHGTDVKDIENNMVEISPNPASDYIQIKFFDINESANILIFNSFGSKIVNLNLSEDNDLKAYMINTKQLSSGIYYCQITQGQKTTFRKFVILK